MRWLARDEEEREEEERGALVLGGVQSESKRA